MKRTPKSFDATVRQDPKHMVLMGLDDIEESDEGHPSVAEQIHEEDLTATLNRLQVSAGDRNNTSQDDIGTIGSSSRASFEDATMDEKHGSSDSAATTARKSARKSSGKKKKKSDNAELLESWTTTITTLQEEEEQSFSRCLDSGVRSVVLAGFLNAKDEDGKQFTVFRVEIVTVAQAWVVYRRYSDFVNLSSKLGDLSPPNFPPKTPFGGNFARDFLLKRQTHLSQWLERALQTPGVVTMSEMRSFLVAEANRAPASRDAEMALPGKFSSSSSMGSASEKMKDELPLFGTPRKDPAAPSLSAPVTPSSTTGVTAASTPTTPSNSTISYSDASPRLERSSSKSPFTANGRKVKMEDFQMLQVLGKGSFGKVVLCAKRTGRDANCLYAMKILNKQNVVSKKQVEHTLTERSVLGKMNHPFIVKLHYAFQTDKKLHFVLDYCPGGELFFHLGRSGKFSEDQGRFYAAEITLALGHLHSHGVVYRDLKPENILFEANGHLKLADFGLSKEGVETTQGSHSFCGTPEYLAPEVLNRSGHGMAVDWWSLGALLYEMLTGLPPWFSQDRQKLFLGIRQAPLKFPPEVSPLSQSILSDFLKRNPVERLGSGGVEQVKKHAFFRSIDWVALYDLKVLPPFTPQLNGAADTANFDVTFTRMPVQSEAYSPVQTTLPGAASGTGIVANAPQVGSVPQQHLLAGSYSKRHILGSAPDDGLFGGFTYQEDSFTLATPPTPALHGMYTPPAVSAVKQSSPLRPTSGIYSRPVNTASSSLAKSQQQQQVVPASSPPVKG